MQGYFNDASEYLKEGKILLDRLGDLCVAYESLDEKPSKLNVTLKEAYDKAAENWSIILNNISVVKRQLHQIPEEWLEYQNK